MIRSGLAEFFDRACTELLAMEEVDCFPSGISVHPQIYDLLSSLRARELSNGYQLVVLGLPVERSNLLQPGDFRIIS
jgi:hypothetical protein